MIIRAVMVETPTHYNKVKVVHSAAPHIGIRVVGDSLYDTDE